MIMNKTISGTSSTLYINTVVEDTPSFADQKTYEDDLQRRQKEHLDGIHNKQNIYWRPCLHDSCPECLGTGIKKDGSPCIHNISCPCPKCNPYS